jgi:hypothetical protein
VLFVHVCISIERDIVLEVSARSGCIVAIQRVTDKHWDRWHCACCCVWVCDMWL